MAVVNVHLNGELEMFVNTYIKRGLASTKAEVMRQGILSLMKNEPSDFELAVRKMQNIDKEIEEGKRKVISEEEFLSRHPELKKLMGRK